MTKGRWYQREALDLKERRRKTRNTQPRLRDFEFYDADRMDENVAPRLSGLSSIFLAATPASLMEGLKSTFDQSSDGKVNYWLDTSFLIPPQRYLKGERGGRVVTITPFSFLYSCKMGLCKVDDGHDYNALWKNVKRMFSLHYSTLDGLLERPHVHVTPEVVGEFEHGLDLIQQHRRETKSYEYKSLLEGEATLGERVLEKIKRQLEGGLVEKLRAAEDLKTIEASCASVARQKGISTSQTDHAIVAYALLGAACEGCANSIISSDRGILQLLRVLEKRMRNGRDMNVKHVLNAVLENHHISLNLKERSRRVEDLLGQISTLSYGRRTQSHAS